MVSEQSPESSAQSPRQPSWRSFWMKTMIQWHWISSAVCLVGMLLFAVTGITLNHAGQIQAEPAIETIELELPANLHKSLLEGPVEGDAALPAELSKWLSSRLPKSIGSRPAEWSDYEVYLSMPGPGMDSWLAIDRETGTAEFEQTSRGWIAYFNDLHKGRNTGAGWKLFIDVFSIATLVFCISGLFLLVLHAQRRKMTWPLVGLGLIVPLLMALLLIH